MTTIRGLLLRRSAAVVYAEGLGAFDRTGQQSVGVLSLAGVVEPIVGLLTDETHDRVRWAAILTLTIATGMGATTLALNRGFARFRALGLAALLAAAPGFLVAWGSGFLLGRFGSDDPFEQDLRLIFEGMLDVPQRNFLIVGILGLTVAVVGFPPWLRRGPARAAGTGALSHSMTARSMSHSSPYPARPCWLTASRRCRLLHWQQVRPRKRPPRTPSPSPRRLGESCRDNRARADRPRTAVSARGRSAARA